MTTISIFQFSIFIVGTLWIITLLAYWYEKKRVRVVKKNSDWAIDKSREKAETIIQEAKNAALKELADVKVEVTKYEQELESGVKKLTDQEIAQYKEMIGKITADVEAGVKLDSSQFKIEFDKAWKGMQEEMKTKIEADYQEEKKKLEEYRGVKMREIENVVAGIVDEAVLAVLEKQADEQVNRKLIVDAIEEISKEYAK